MFTGIIESTAKVLKITSSGLTLERPTMFDDIKIGSSIAVSGVCLSVVAFDKKSMSFDVVPMTFSKTKLGSLKAGDSVNLERAMKADARFEGHIVTGHCEGVGEVVVVPFTAPTPGPSPRLLREQRGEGACECSEYSDLGHGVGADTGAGTLLRIDIPPAFTSFIVPHGSITLDGVSLTVASLKRNQLTVALIPHTLEHSTLGFLQKGDPINIETDILAKYVLSSRS